MDTARTWICWIALCACALAVSGCGAAPAEAAAAVPAAPVFRVTFEGMEPAEFSDVGGLGLSVEVVEYRDGTDGTVRKLPGRTTYGDITLERGFTADSALEDWIQQGRTGTIDRRTVTVELLAAGSGKVLKAWTCHDCWPRGWRLVEDDCEDRAGIREETVLVVGWFEEA